MAGMSLEIIVFIGIFAFVLIGAAVIRLTSGAPSASKQAGKISARVARAAELASEDPMKAAGDKANPGSLRRSIGDKSLPLLTKIFAHSAKVQRLRDRLARAGFTMTAERYLVINGLLFAIIAGIIMLLSSKPPIFGLLIGFAIGFGLPNFIINFRIARMTRQFLTLFPDAIDLIVRGLKAGLPATESMKMVGREIDEPVGSVFRTISEKMALGIPLEKTLYDTARKYRITEFDFFVTSIILQRETGGNLSEILGNLSDALRGRLMMRMKIKAMSSEARASMYIIGALPFFVLGALAITSPDYLEPLINDFRGNIAAFVAVGMLSLGMWIMMRMAKFEI